MLESFELKFFKYYFFLIRVPFVGEICEDLIKLVFDGMQTDL